MNFFLRKDLAEQVDDYLVNDPTLLQGGYFLFTGKQCEHIIGVRSYLESLGHSTTLVHQYADRAYQYEGERLYINPQNAPISIPPRTGHKLIKAYYGVE